MLPSSNFYANIKMTQAICISCGHAKFGAYVRCLNCDFVPSTLLDLTMSEAYSDQRVRTAELDALAAHVRQSRKVVEEKRGTLEVDVSIFNLLEERLGDQSFRDPLVLIKNARDALFTKELNVHLIGTDGYVSQIARRGNDLDPTVFDDIRETGDGDLYLTYFYKEGRRHETSVTKRLWYIVYDKLLLIDRQTIGDPYIAMLDAMYEGVLDSYAEHGSIQL